jgi:hypothetical protein
MESDGGWGRARKIKIKIKIKDKDMVAEGAPRQIGVSS